ncbi:MAG TPA: ion channel [Acidimicrobiales bacterium]|nr:ion channel [Acidimicrobiales bacterium]
MVRRGMLREAAKASDSYGLLLFLVFIDYLLLSVPWEGPYQVVTSTLFVSATALLGFHTSHVRGAWLRAVRIASVVAVVSSLVAAVTYGHQATSPHGHRATGITFMIIALLILATPLAVVTRIVQHKRVTAETLMGAIAVYVLIGLVFAYADYGLQLISQQAFFAQPPPASGHFNEQTFVYYSFITMTTVGYGDFSPAAGLPRNFAVIEALTGQIFLVIMVSRLVALYTPRARGERRRMLAAGMRGAVDDVEDPEVMDRGPEDDLGEAGPEPAAT